MKNASRPCRAESAFTLIEMLVVIAIIVALLGLIVGSIGQFSRVSNKAATQQMLAGIETALSAYDLDWKDMPPSQASGSVGAVDVTNWEGGEIMVQALVAPNAQSVDGKNGDGFAVNSKPYGPYMEIKSDNTIVARWDKDNSGGGTGGAGELYKTTSPGQLSERQYAYVLTMASSAGKAPILYYRKQTGPGRGSRPIYDYANDQRTTDSDEWVWGEQGMFDVNHNEELVGAFNIQDNPDTDEYSDDETSVDFIAKGYWGMPPHDPDPSDDDTRTGPPRELGESFVYELRSATYLLVAPGNDDLYGTEDDVISTGK